MGVLSSCKPTRITTIQHNGVTFKIEFLDIYHGELNEILPGRPKSNGSAPIAEKALVTLQGRTVPFIAPAYNLSLSLQNGPKAAMPRPSSLPRYLLSAQLDCSVYVPRARLFDLARSYGPLFSVEVDVNLGFFNNACVLRYWEEDDAKDAERHVWAIGGTSVLLRAFDPCKIACSVSNHSFVIRRIIDKLPLEFASRN